MSKKWETIDCVIPFARDNFGRVICEDDQDQIHDLYLSFYPQGIDSSQRCYDIQWRETRKGVVDIRLWDWRVKLTVKCFTSALNPAQIEFLIDQNASSLTKDMLKSAKAKVIGQLAAMGHRVTPPETKLVGSAPA